MPSFSKSGHVRRRRRRGVSEGAREESAKRKREGRAVDLLLGGLAVREEVDRGAPAQRAAAAQANGRRVSGSNLSREEAAARGRVKHAPRPEELRPVAFLLGNLHGHGHGHGHGRTRVSERGRVKDGGALTVRKNQSYCSWPNWAAKDARRTAGRGARVSRVGADERGEGGAGETYGAGCRLGWRGRLR